MKTNLTLGISAILELFTVLGQEVFINQIVQINQAQRKYLKGLHRQLMKFECSNN